MTRRRATRHKMGAAALTLAISAGLVVAARLGIEEAEGPRLCADGLVQLGARCCGEGQRLEAGTCRGAPTRCAATQRATPEGCVADGVRVELPAGRVERLPTDWDDRGGGSAAMAELAPFAIDRHEVTESAYTECARTGACSRAPLRGEAGLPQTSVTAAQAAAYCAWRGGRLPKPEEFAYAAMGRAGRRYPWGDAGAVCRRVVHGLVEGPCARNAAGPQLAGSAANGATPEGVYDLAGNVEEWVRSDDGSLEARGGSYRDASVTALRTFATRRLARDGDDRARGFRCVYAPDAR